MKFTAKLKLFSKIILVLLLVAALFTYLNYAMSRKPSREATIESKTVQVGSPFPGTIVEIAVKESEMVKKGQTLVRLQGPDITAALKKGDLSESDSVHILNNDQIALLALQDGIVDNLQFASGSYVTANDAIMSLNQMTDQYVVASFRLSPPDYARVSDNTRLLITLPDNTELQAKLTDISLNTSKTSDTEVLTVVTAEPTSGASALSRFPVGTPVRATLILDGATWFERLREYSQRLLQPKG